MACLETSLLSLMNLSSQNAQAPSMFISEFYPKSFDIPFDDPAMEPIPFATLNETGTDKLQSIEKENECQTLPSTLEPAIATSSGSKRAFDSFSSPPDLPTSSQPNKKRQKDDAHPFLEDESIARFRPYQENQWRVQFQKLVRFTQENGHCLVPHTYPEDPILARWVKRQRYQYKKLNDQDPSSTMTTRRIEELESIGFVWHSHHAAWHEKLNELKAFKRTYGHCNVPSHNPENIKLSTWVKGQRRQYKLFNLGKSCNMTSERYEALDSLGFLFDTRRKSSTTI